MVKVDGSPVQSCKHLAQPWEIDGNRLMKSIPILHNSVNFSNLTQSKWKMRQGCKKMDAKKRSSNGPEMMMMMMMMMRRRRRRGISETRCDEMACQYVLRCHVVLTFLNSVRVWGQLTHPPAKQKLFQW